MIKGAKSIAEYVIHKWLQSEGFEMHYFKLAVRNNEAMIVDNAGDTLWLVYDNDIKFVYAKEQGGARVFDILRRITVLELVLDYTPGRDDNHSHSVLLEMLDELRAEEMDPSGGNCKGPMGKQLSTFLL